MKNKYTKEEIAEAYESLKSDQSLVKAIVGSVLGLILGIVIYVLFALAGATFVVLLFLPPAIVGVLAGFLGKPFETRLMLIIFVVGMATYFIGLYWIFTAHNYLLILLTPVSGFIAIYCSKFHISKIQKHAIWKKQYE